MTLALFAAASVAGLAAILARERRMSPLRARAAHSTLQAALRRERSHGR